jgi:tetratricopeptide (TPR) repeat protein
MGTYQVVKTPGGGLWVRETDGVDMAAMGAVALAGSALGSALASAGRAADKIGRYSQKQVWAAVLDAKDSEDWPLAYQLAKQFVRRYPDQEAGYEALADAAACAGLSPDDQHRATDLLAANGGSREDVAMYRMRAYFDAEDMANTLREANTVVACKGEQEVLGRAFRARALLWLGDLDQALSDANAAVSLSPDALCYAVRADVSWARGELAKALIDYSFAIRLEPDEPRLLEKRASVCEARGSHEAAAADRRAAQELWQERLGSSSRG